MTHGRCTQCEAAMINGVYCHETGCQNIRHECHECGTLLPIGERGDCRDCRELDFVDSILEEMDADEYLGDAL